MILPQMSSQTPILSLTDNCCPHKVRVQATFIHPVFSATLIQPQRWKRCSIPEPSLFQRETGPEGNLSSISWNFVK